MKTQKELREELNRAYTAASEQAGIESWNKLAEYVGIPYTSIYRVITDRGSLTESLLRRIQMELAQKGIVIEGSPFANNTSGAGNNAQNITAPVTQTTTDERWFDLVAEKDAQINRLLCIIEKMQA